MYLIPKTVICLKKIVTLIQGRTSDEEVNGVRIRLLRLVNNS